MDLRAIERILPLLTGTMPSGDSGKQWVACCPAHEDAKQSLAVGDTGDRVVVKCYAGCTFDAIAAALNLTKPDFFDDRRERQPKGVTVAGLAFDKRFSAGWLKNFCGLRDEGGPGNRYVLIPYRDRGGSLMFERTRTAAKAKDGTRQPKGVKPEPYGLWLLEQWKTGGRLILVEGESDCWAGWHHGFPVLGIPGSQATQRVDADLVAGFTTVYVWQEPDKAGGSFAADVCDRLAGIPGLTVLVVSIDGVKDPCDLHQRFADAFPSEFEKALAAAKPFDPLTSPRPAAKRGRTFILPPENPDGTEQPQFPLTDYGNAERLAWQRGRDIRYVWHGDKSGEWFAWDGCRWARNAMPTVSQFAMATVRTIYKEAEKEDDALKRQAISLHAVKSESWNAFNAMTKHAAALKHFASYIECFDREPFLLNVQNGTVDLESGRLIEHKREHFSTHIAPVFYDEAATCPTWESFLEVVFSREPENPGAEGDEDLIAFIQRLLGYCLTGDVSEHILPIFWGGGANGKSTLLNVMADILGSGYAAKAPQGMLMKKHGEQHPTELTILQGARFVYASETSRSGRLSEELVKDLTSGEKITARRMRMDFYSFDPTHKLILCTNHQPRIGETDEGIWRRVRMVPFNARFWNPDTDVGPEHLRQDKTLGDRLKYERSGILNWLVRGAIEWRRQGLAIPKRVKDETESYRAEEDTFGQYLTENWQKSNIAELKPLLLLSFVDHYRRQMDIQNVPPMSNRNVAAELRRRGYVVKPGNHNKSYIHGIIGINTDNATAQDSRGVSRHDD